MNTTSKTSQQKPSFKLEDIHGLSREHLARVCDIMDMGSHFEDLLLDGSSMDAFDKEVREYLEEHIHLKFNKNDTTAIKEVLAENYRPVWCSEVNDHMRAIKLLNMGLCEKGDTKKAFKKLTKSYKKLKKFMENCYE